MILLTLTMDITNIYSLTDFLRNHKTHVARIKKTKKPEVLTIKGKSELVLIDAKEYQKMSNTYKNQDLVDFINAGVDEALSGKVKSKEEVFKLLFKKYGI